MRLSIGRLHRAAAAAALLVAAFATPVRATQEYILPTLFDVVDVAADDVLNIRAAPDAAAPVIGALAPDLTRIEVVAHDATGRWAQVNVGERAGWVALRYLAYRIDVWESGTLPDGLLCLGTEPFWSFAPLGEDVIYATPDGQQRLRRDAVLDTGIFRDPRRVLFAGTDGMRLTATILPIACSDGMSDRAYGLDATVIIETGAGRRLLTGCCTIASD